MRHTSASCALLVFVLAAAPALTAQRVIVLSGGGVLSVVDAAAPGSPISSSPVTGLAAGEQLLGIDFRPANGQLYALGSSSRLYTVDVMTGAATPVGGGPFGPALSGTRFGVDFNPTVDRLRVVSDARQNLRLDPVTGAVASSDPMLAFAATDPNAGRIPDVSGAGYTNSFAGATTTVLYDIDTDLDVLVTQNPANAGTLNTVGPLGVNAADAAGFDIAPDGTALAALTSPGLGVAATGLFRISLANGAATFVGSIGVPGVVRGLAIMPAAAMAPPAAEQLVALGANGMLAFLDSRAPGGAYRTVAVSGLQPGEALLAIDFRPSNRQLYGLGSTSRIYTLSTETGAATAVGAPFSPALAGTRFGFDFNPVPDLIRIVSDADQNLRVNPATGALAGMDAALAFAGGDENAGIDPNVGGAAYANNVAGATATTLYDIDSVLDVLVTQVPANSGQLQTVGPLGINVSGVLGFDISGATGVAYAALATLGTSGASDLFTIDLGSGAARFAGTIGLPSPVIGLSVMPQRGLTTYGRSTEGCNGPIAIAAGSDPVLGNAAFRIMAANASPLVDGFLGISDALPASTPTLLMGAEMLIDTWSPAAIYFHVVTDAAGRASLGFAIPNAASLVGLPLYAQWAFGDACQPLGVAASNGLAIVIQP